VKTSAFICAVAILLIAAGTGLKPFSFPKLPHFPAPYPAPAFNPTTQAGAELGRHLFYDPVLSADSMFSCASCHKQEQAFSGSPESFSKGVTGNQQKRNTPALFNLAWAPTFFWDGRVGSLEEQALFPVRGHIELNLSWTEAGRRVARRPFYQNKFATVFPGQHIDSTTITRALAQFERTLLSVNSRYDQAIHHRTRLTLEELEGFELINDMTKGNCNHCHTSDADGRGTTYEYANNGLDRPGHLDSGRASVTRRGEDLGKFRIPSLRNLSYTAPYMHDGRFSTLEQVVDFYADSVHAGPTTDNRLEAGQAGRPRLTSLERKKIVAFLRAMDDPSFVRDKRYANPWARR
jgi:cytochrome c peroxidase